MKTKFILHGGFASKDNESNRAFWEELAKDVPDGGTVLLVLFVTAPEDVSSRIERVQEIVEKHAEGKHFRFVVATREGFLDELKNADAVYIPGGDTTQLLEILKSYPDLVPYVQGKTIAGSSAGAYAFVRFGAAHTSEHMREGLGMVPVRLICHYESSELPPTENSVAELKATAPELELVMLKDFDWKTYIMEV